MVPSAGANELLFLYAHVLQLAAELESGEGAAEATNALVYWFVNAQDE